MRIELPDKVTYIIRTLQEHGYEAYAVGGCVRDSLLGRTPGDWDITTSADPYETKALFPRTIDTGIRHGTVTVMCGKQGFEVTTYRIDGEYEDGRHPKQVSFTKSLKEDLARRDFTINAMAYNEEDGLIDRFGGADDLRQRVIRCVGDPGSRFDEDALRILRAFRFAAQLNFTIEEKTYAAAKEKAVHLSRISAERIQTELNKLLLSAHPEVLTNAYQAGLTGVFLPEFDRLMKEQDEGENLLGLSRGQYAIEVLKALTEVSASADALTGASALTRASDLSGVPVSSEPQNPADSPAAASLIRRGCTPKERLILSLAVLLQPIGEEAASRVLKRLKYDNETIRGVRHLIRYYDCDWPLTPAGVRRAMHEIGTEPMRLLLLLRAARNSAGNGEGAAHLNESVRLYHGVLERKECVSLKDLAVGGEDLIQAGFRPGRELGEILAQLLMRVIEDPKKNQKELLLAEAGEIAERIQSSGSRM